jgi:hypothetical protein
MTCASLKTTTTIRQWATQWKLNQLNGIAVNTKQSKNISFANILAQRTNIKYTSLHQQFNQQELK